jgi:hypothetical protein
MADSDAKSIIETYLNAWVRQDQEKAKSLCAPTLRFISPQDKFYNSDDFFNECWKHSEGLTDVKLMKSVYDDKGGFAIIEWFGEGGKSFLDAEFFRVQTDRIAEIIVLNNFPDFADMVR